MNEENYNAEEIQVLERRAQTLAVETATEKEREKFSYVAVITVGNESFGIAVKSFVEVVKTPSITRVPDLPEWISGIVQIRGELITVVDMARWFRIASSGKCDLLAIVAGPPGLLGLQIETTVGFRIVYADEIVQTLKSAVSTTGRPFQATTRDLLTLIDTKQLFKNQQIIIGGSE